MVTGPLKLDERDRSIQKKSKVNWCPKCATVRGDQQVVDGCCWRHEDTLVEQRELEQWFVRTTKYAEELLRDLDKLKDWPDKVRTMQRNWIGCSEGTLVDFKLDGTAGPGFYDQCVHHARRHDFRRNLGAVGAGTSAGG